MDSHLRALYPEIDPIHSECLDPCHGHTVYYEVCGNPNGIPVIFLHGGPGSGCNENHRRYFNPDKYKIIIFDQRGCNRSQPRGEIVNNTTDLLISDMERMRIQLGIDQWLLFGGSWGATLALLYAEQHPETVSGMILRGSFLARQSDLDWFISGGVERIFPDDWQHFQDAFTIKNTNPVELAIEWIFSEDVQLQRTAATAWAKWSGRIVTASILSEYRLEIDDEQRLIDDTRIEMHYAKNRYFILENQILDNINKIPNVPIHIIHGRRDLTCLPEASWLLKKALPKAKLKFLAEAGHLAGEPAMVDALIQSTDEMFELLG